MSGVGRSPPSIIEADRKQCPSCGRVSPAGRDLCRYCWTGLTGAPVLSAAEAAALEAHDRRQEAERARRARIVRTARIVAVLLAVWLGYRLWFAGAPAPPLSSSTARSLASTPAAWARADGDAGGTRSTMAAVALDAQVRWRAHLDATPLWEAVATDSMLLVGLDDGTLRAHSASDGSELWRVEVPGNLDAPPAVAGDRVFAGYRDGRVVALDASSGAEVWSRPVEDTVSRSPLVERGTVFAASLRGLHAIDAETGGLLWSRDLQTSFVSIDPVVAGANVLVAAHDRVRVFDRDDGSDVFHYRIRRPQRLLAREGSAFVLSTTGAVAFDEDARRPWWDGTRRAWGQLYAWRVAPRPPDQPAMWRLPLDEWSWAALAPWGLAISSGDSVEARAAASGSVLWRREDLEVSVAPIAVAGGLLVVAGDRLCLLASDSGSDLGCLTALGTSIRFVTPVAGVPSSSRTRSWSRWGTDAPRGRLRPGDRGAVRSASDHIHDSAVAIDKT